MEVQERIRTSGIIPVVQLAHPRRDAEKLAGALLAGGVPVAEVTFRRAGAEEAIHRMRSAFPQLLVGAGTVLTPAQVRAARDAGAQFVVTPGMDPLVVKACLEAEMPIFPGCSTPTDYHTAYRYGLTMVKFFPAEQAGGVAALKALHGPFPMFQVIPTGGITLDNLAHYLRCPPVAACGGSFLTPERLIEEQRWEEISGLCAQAAAVVKEARGNG